MPLKEAIAAGLCAAQTDSRRVGAHKRHPGAEPDPLHRSSSGPTT